MAVFNAPQFVDASLDSKRLLPYEEHGKMRSCYGFFKNLTGGALAIGDQVNLFKLPPGNVRLLPYLSMIRNTAIASGTLSIGLRAYTQSFDAADIAEAETELLNAKAIGSAGAAALAATIKYDLFSKRGITVYATLRGAGFPNNGEIELNLPYLYE